MTHTTSPTSARPPRRASLIALAPCDASQRLRWSAGVGATILAELIGLGVPYTLKLIIDRALPARDPLSLARWLLLALGLQLAVALLRGVGRVVIEAVAEDSALAVRQRAFTHLMAQDLGFHTAHNTGTRGASILLDTSQLRALLGGGLPAVARVIAGGAATALALVWLAPALVPVAAGLALATLLIGWFARRRLASAQQRALHEQTALYGAIVEALTGVEQITLMGLVPRAAARVQERGARWREANLSLSRWRALGGGLVAAWSAVALLGALGAGAALMFSGAALTTGALVAFYAYLGRLVLPARAAANLVIGWPTYQTSLDRLAELFATTPTLRAPDTPRDPGPLRVLTLRDVWFRYPPAPEVERAPETGGAGDAPGVLRGVSLEARPGERVAILGPSGAGKSTLGRLLSRLLDPTRGAVLVNGVPLSEQSLEQVRGRVGHVGQEVFLWGESVRECLQLGASDGTPWTDAQLERACAIACVDELLTTRGADLDTPIGADGRALSGGQRKRVALARALLRTPELLIIDQLASDLEASLNARIFRALGRDAMIVMYLGHRVPDGFAPDAVFWLEDGVLIPRPDLIPPTAQGADAPAPNEETP